ncbi:hypothetical protein ACQCT3_18085 [Sutcliffiella horikoshii]|uniref:hypothetical protein n=1 Tax=Sutcliffiella horikoshii TaxID=79883 RepID=UPI003CE8047F
MITQYIDKLEGRSKRHVLMIITPKGDYPTQFMNSSYEQLERSVLKNPDSYISLFEDDIPEVMQYVAFRLFLKPVICDKKYLHNNTVEKNKRMKKEDITAFVVTKYFYDTVPYGKKTEDEAINEGLVIAKDFLKKYPTEEFEYATVHLEKDSNGANVFIKLDFSLENDNYVLDYIYVR